MFNKESFQERMYQRSIDVYEYQGKKNSTWMHLYAIFTGAFFVAFYTLISSDKTDISQVFFFLILIMGLFTSICWLGAYHAYHSWLKNYVKTMHFREDELLNERYELNEWNEPNEQIRMKYVNRLRLHTLGFSKDLKDGLLFGRLSGDKINKFFIFIVILGWVFLLLSYAFKEAIESFIFTRMLSVIFVLVSCLFLVIIFILFGKSNGIERMWMVEKNKKRIECKIVRPDEELKVIRE